MMEMKVAANAPAAVVDVAMVRWFAIAPAASDAVALMASATISAEGVSLKWLLCCHAAANAYNRMRQVPCVRRRAVTCAAVAAHARNAVEATALSDRTWMVPRASAVPRSVAAGLILVAPAALVAPAYRHRPAAVSAGVMWPVVDSRVLHTRLQRWCGSSLCVLGLAEVTCATERSASAVVAAALDDASCNRRLTALSSCRRAPVTLRDVAAAYALLAPTLALMEAEGRRRKGRRSISAARPEMLAAARAASRRRRPADVVHSAACCAALGALSAVSTKWSW